VERVSTPCPCISALHMLQIDAYSTGAGGIQRPIGPWPETPRCVLLSTCGACGCCRGCARGPRGLAHALNPSQIPVNLVCGALPRWLCGRGRWHVEPAARLSATSSGPVVECHGAPCMQALNVDLMLSHARTWCLQRKRTAQRDEAEDEGQDKGTG
jgi:hypothetical protein